MLQTSERLRGTEHSDTARCLTNLAYLYKRQNKFAEAEPLFVRALAIFEQRSGPQHPDTALCHRNLVALYMQQEKYTAEIDDSMEKSI